jgi:BirA family biotin operon repressor/biotin-[acetyl-CoA-carboxylase] ligase
VREAWLARAAGLGGPIRVRLDSAELTGTFAGIDADGALMLTLADGHERRITAGDVFFPAVSSGVAAG